MRSAIMEELDKNGVTVCTTKGDSMEPLLANRRDIVTIRKTKPGERLKKYDVVLFERPNGENVMHRIVDVLDDGYLILGDNCINKEYVKEEAVIGIMTGLIRNNKTIKVTDRGYRFYSKLWYALYPLRRPLMRIRNRNGE